MRQRRRWEDKLDQCYAESLPTIHESALEQGHGNNHKKFFLFEVFFRNAFTNSMSKHLYNHCMALFPFVFLSCASAVSSAQVLDQSEGCELELD